MRRIKVAAAVIIRDGRVLLSSRPHGRHLAGMWEFPGGKIEACENTAQALTRELHEELDIEVIPCDLLGHCIHDYREKSVELFFVRCIFPGKINNINANENQLFKFADAGELAGTDLVEADRDFAVFLRKILKYLQ